MPPISEFPNPNTATEEGLLAVGGDLHVDSLKLAYGSGIFPWPLNPQSPLLWFCPDPRAILKFSNLHIPKRLERDKKNSKFTFSFNQAFESVIEACALIPRPVIPEEAFEEIESVTPQGNEIASPTKSDSVNKDAKPEKKYEVKTWITPYLAHAYTEFHKAGFAHSVEAWEKDELVGGIYGVSVNGTFAAESMFFKKSNASKLALLHLIDYLQAKGLDWIDIQMMTEHMKKFGATEVPRKEFLKLLSDTQKKKLKLF